MTITDPQPPADRPRTMTRAQAVSAEMLELLKDHPKRPGGFWTIEECEELAQRAAINAAARRDQR